MVEGKTPDQVMNEPWNYDRVRDHYDVAIRHAQEFLRGAIGRLRESDKKIKFLKGGLKGAGTNRRKRSRMELDLNGLEEVRREQQKIKEYFEEYRERFEGFRRRFSESKAVLIGPATLDSLIDRQPEDYDYVDNTRLPFEHLFFDFAVPYVTTFPFTQNLQAAMIGTELHPAPDLSDNIFKSSIRLFGIDASDLRRKSTCYEARVPFVVDGSDNLVEIGLYFQRVVDSRNKSGLLMIGGFHLPDSDDFHFFYNPLTDKMAYKRVDNSAVGTQGRGGLHLNDVSFLDSKEEANVELLTKLPRLCVNLVNYINAHNVTVVERESHQRRYPKGKAEPAIIPAQQRRPFYLVTVKDGVEERQEKEGEKTELKWRVYVRGHDRRYRDDKGDIYMTSWVSPHIRGPEGAPWKENRYQVLAEKLEQEKALLARFWGKAQGKK